MSSHTVSLMIDAMREIYLDEKGKPCENMATLKTWALLRFPVSVNLITRTFEELEGVELVKGGDKK